MDVNEWDYLAGCKKPKGHDADRYNLTFLDDNLLPDYKRYLLKGLAIDSDHEDDAPQPFKQESTESNSIIQLLREELEDLRQMNKALLAQFLQLHQPANG